MANFRTFHHMSMPSRKTNHDLAVISKVKVCKSIIAKGTCFNFVDPVSIKAKNTQGDSVFKRFCLQFIQKVITEFEFHELCQLAECIIIDVVGFVEIEVKKFQRHSVPEPCTFHSRQIIAMELEILQFLHPAEGIVIDVGEFTVLASQGHKVASSKA